MHRKYIAFAFVCSSSIVATRLPAAVTIETVRVGNPGNASDPADGASRLVGVQHFGHVPYEFDIGKYEVTAAQYTAFLNAVAATDTYGLYSPPMATDLKIARIGRSGSPGSYSYNVISSPNAPVSHVSWGDAIRFANWLHNGQPTGAQNASTTEDGAYSLNGAVSEGALALVTRNAGAKWFLPSEDEWYKAAYHQPAAQGGDADDYWAYPTRSNSPPYSDQPPGSGAPTASNAANFRKDDRVANGYDDGFAVTGSNVLSNTQYYLTDVGAYALAVGPYGTFDQGGNCVEWTDTLGVGPGRVWRGGGYQFSVDDLAASGSDFNPAVEQGDGLGFRVARVPEPSTAILAIFACGVALWWRRRRP